MNYFKIRLWLNIILSLTTVILFMTYGFNFIFLIPYGVLNVIKFSVKKFYTYKRDFTPLTEKDKIKKYNRVIDIINGYYE